MKSFYKDDEQYLFSKGLMSAPMSKEFEETDVTTSETEINL